MEQFLAVTPVERREMPLQEFVVDAPKVMASQLEEFTRLRRAGEAPWPGV
jgi:hypothetical protein